MTELQDKKVQRYAKSAKEIPNQERARWITIEGARTNNLREVSVKVPKYQLTVFTGVSGSGKSSLAFGTIAAEAQRLVADSYPLFVRNRLPSSGNADVEHIDGLTFSTVVDQKPFTGNARSTVGTASDIAPLLRMLFSRCGEPSAGYSPAYSFNDVSGMCPACEGLGVVSDIDEAELIDTSRSLNDGAICYAAFRPGTYRWKRMVTAGLFDAALPLEQWSAEELRTLLYARDLPLNNPDPEYPKSARFDGVIPRLQDSYLRKKPSRLTQDERAGLDRIIRRAPCSECGGTRLNAAARTSLIDGRSIADWNAMSIRELRDLVAGLRNERVQPLLHAIRDRLDVLVSVGLGYLSLDRPSGTLSGGEAQRVKILRHLGSALSDACYIFDEPSAGLHPHDIHRLLRLLTQLRDAHNTVLLVEHHPVLIAHADHVIDLGPGAGSAGGRVCFEGSPAELIRSETTTGQALRQPIILKAQPRPGLSSISIKNAHTHNLRDLSVEIPLGVLTAVTGVAGSGKSSLAATELPRQHPEFVVIGQESLHGGIRSTPATVLGIAERIRRAFAAGTGLPESWFSANARGACPECKGKGVIVTDLAFLEDVSSTCEACGGTRFNDKTLAATLSGHTIADILGMNPAQARRIFESYPDITDRLAWLDDVGLKYLALGQGLDTLSGGEKQRLMLAKHLAQAGELSDLRIVLDEPTAGLHVRDTDKLLNLFDRLVDGGATVVVIEHNQRVIAHADHVIDLGPGAGTEGGNLVYQGSPAGLLACASSLTAKYLREVEESSTISLP
ncbi:excinuclease ABC subunit UvrA [Corynebacterium flavescens]|uniref:excinuclease ABC subunit UvrA n=1 Tax=Corynebacterium flavescens TaxID=28028 RepID=UPI00289A2D34|nr:excinuclease ABC subunit UvrA [Corynebacterium flavescens]